MTIQEFKSILDDNQGLATAVVFMGGESDQDLVPFLLQAQEQGYKTCLYTGISTIQEVPEQIKSKLDYCKTGRWMGKPLSDPSSNQRFWDVKSDKDITHIFKARV